MFAISAMFAIIASIAMRAIALQDCGSLSSPVGPPTYQPPRGCRTNLAMGAMSQTRGGGITAPDVMTNPPACPSASTTTTHQPLPQCSQ